MAAEFLGDVTSRLETSRRLGAIEASLDRMRLENSQASRKPRPADLLFKAMTVVIVQQFVEGGSRPVLEVLKHCYGEDNQVRTVMAKLVAKAAAIPADTTVSGWADTLVQTVITDLIDSLLPLSIYPKLAALGDSFSFGRNGVVSVLARNTSTSVASAFVLQGAPIPVKQGGFASALWTPKKMATITMLTREITQHSTPSIENIVKKAIMEDTAVALDAVLLDATAASATRPAGLRNGVTKITASGTNSIVGLIADLRGLATAFITGTKGNFRAPVWIMNPGDVLAAMLLPASTGGDLVFQEQLSRGTLLGFPVLTSTTVTADMIILVDAADFISTTGEDPQFSMSDQGTVHQEDTSPAPIATSPGVWASPTRSFFQTDVLGIRMVLDINFGMRRSGIIQWMDTLAWSP